MSTTAATIGLADLQSVYTTLPVRWRPNSTWLMNPLAQSTIQNLGTAVSARYTTDATGVPDRLLTRPIATDDYAPYLVDDDRAGRADHPRRLQRRTTSSVASA